MRLLSCFAVALAAFSVSLGAGPAAAQSIPVAKITVPLKIHNVDAEFIKVHPMTVLCQIPAGPDVPATTVTVQIPFVITAATTTTRATADFEGNVVANFDYTGRTMVGGDVERATQAGAQAFIKAAGPYLCVLMTGSSASTAFQVLSDIKLPSATTPPVVTARGIFPK